MGVLDTITSPEDLRDLDVDGLRRLSGELRQELVQSVCATGGHLGPNLGVVEVTLAVHRVFDSPRTPIVFDTGHQAYVHKMITGRRAAFAGLRTRDGLSGYPNRGESVHDVVENSHASTALSYADGLARASDIGGHRRQVVVVLGDGSLTGGLAWEGLNNLGRSGSDVVVVLNDNGRSYAPTVGGMPAHLARLVDRARYQSVQDLLGGDGPHRAPGLPSVPGPVDGRASGMFEDLGLGYVGPIDGHDIEALEDALRLARDRRGPVVVHCLTEKGRGFPPAVAHEADHYHTVGVVQPSTGQPVTPPSRTWTDAFAEAMVEAGAERADIVGVSAAMLGPTGLQRFADRYPERCFDVGIAEQHAVTTATGLALGGLHPVVALYATFANRAFDQTLLDAGLHRQPVTLVLDRAGITGPDGPSHHGMWDLALLGIVPRIRIAAPRDAASLAEEFREALDVDDGPTALRYPKAPAGPPVPALWRTGGVDVLREPTTPPQGRAAADVLLVSIGALADVVLEAASTLAGAGIECTVADPRWVHPPPDALTELADHHRLVVTVEDGVRSGGVGSRVAQALADAELDMPVCTLGLPDRYLPHGSRPGLLADAGLDAYGIATSVKEAWGRLSGPPRFRRGGGRRGAGSRWARR